MPRRNPPQLPFEPWLPLQPKLPRLPPKLPQEPLLPQLPPKKAFAVQGKANTATTKAIR